MRSRPDLSALYYLFRAALDRDVCIKDLWMESCQISLRAQTYFVSETETHERSRVVRRTRRVVDIYFRVAPLRYSYINVPVTGHVTMQSKDC